LEFIAKRFEKFGDTTPVRKLLIRARKFIEYIPRNNSDTDDDYKNFGYDSDKDTIAKEIDFESDADTETSPVDDLGPSDLFTDPRNESDSTGVFRHALRVATRFGPLRLARLVFNLVASNVRNGIGSGQVVGAGDVGFNLLLDNIPFTKDGTHIALVFDVDVDVEDGNFTRRLDKPLETDSLPDAPVVEDDSESSVDFADSTRIRIRNRAYCEGGKSLIIRMRYVKVTGENPTGFAIRKRLIITVHFDSSARCKRIFLDPSFDVNNSNDPGPQSSQSGSGSGSGSASGSGSSSGASMLIVSFLISFIALLF